MAHTYLSDDWYAATQKIQEEMGDIDVPPLVKQLRVNLTVVDGPEGDKELHMAGGASMQPGHLPDAPTTVTVPFEVAKAVFIDGNASAAMNALSRGQIKIDGDRSKVMALQAIPNTPQQQELQKRIQEVTA